MRRSWQESWLGGWYRSIFLEQTLPGPVRLNSREAAVDIHQLRAGHWSASTQYLHCVGPRPTATCPGCLGRWLPLIPLLALAECGQCTYLQWVPAHSGLVGNERADLLAKEATALEQGNTPIDTSSITRAAARLARQKWRRSWPAGWHSDIYPTRLPTPIGGGSRESAVDVHQLRAGHWSASEQWLHRIGRRPTAGCAGCPDLS